MTEQDRLASLQRLVNDVFAVLTSTPQEIAEQFGESRCVDDHARINYVLEWMDKFVTERA